jgi:class 3 adenylate cyclase/pimeloyl-ACP methyl ester carboxylesterase
MANGEVHYARSGDVDIAWSLSGAGPVDIVFVPGFISQLDLAREIPMFGAILGRLERIGRLVTFDKRGTGLSGRDLGFGSLAERMDDIRIVMDAAGWEKAHLVGVSEGGPLSILFAATYPERVLSMSLYGTYASLRLDDDPAMKGFDVEQFLDFLEREWGNGSAFGRFINAPGDREVRRQLGRYERACASPKQVREIMRSNTLIDATAFAPSVRARTVVIHRREDPMVLFERGRELTALIPGAKLVELPGSFHCGWDARDWAPALDEIEEFITGQSPDDTSAERMLATVLLTDIVGSTERASEMGDRAWRALLDSHDERSATLVERHRGRIVKHTGDGTLAVFDGPGRAVKCAKELSRSLALAGISIRSGLHTGEVEQRGEDIGGIAVHIAARVSALANAGEVLVSRTVHDLVAGSDLRFAERGMHSLKGVPGEWQVFRAVGEDEAVGA